MDPNGNKHVAKVWEVKGVHPDIMERGRWKKTSDGMVMPSEIEQYIRTKMCKATYAVSKSKKLREKVAETRKFSRETSVNHENAKDRFERSKAKFDNLKKKKD